MAITFEIIIPPQFGSATLTTDTQGRPVADYVSNSNYVGPDSFVYVQKEDGEIIETRNVCITVQAPNFPKGWRPSSPTCEVVGGYKTGMLNYITLEEYDTYTGNATGLTKPNTPSDPDYVAPIFDPVTCVPIIGWRGEESSAYCQTDEFNSNTGKKIYAKLEQYYMHNGQATGVTKDNTISDPNYIPPIDDATMCPVGITYTAYRSAIFYSSLCVAPTPTAQPITFTKIYQSTISQADANNMAATDPNFVTDGQQYADDNGTCIASTIYLQYDALKRSTPCDEAGQFTTVVCATQDDFERLSEVTTISTNTGIYFYKDLAGTVKIDAGWYYGWDNNKAFLADNMGQIVRYEECQLVLPSLRLSCEKDVDGNLTINAMLSAVYSQNVRVRGRIDANKLYATEVGGYFDVTIIAGETLAMGEPYVALDSQGDPIPFVPPPGIALYWQNYYAEPNNFTISVDEPF